MWLPSFCDARGVEFDQDGFVYSSLERLSEFDAEWFLRAFDLGFLTQENGYFLTERSKAKEQIFWSGRKGSKPRTLTLWLEPIITIGACARLIEKHGWPRECVGMQSPYPWAFDLVCYQMGTERAIVAGEVKKSDCEVVALLEKMKQLLAADQSDPVKLKGSDRNAYKKVSGLHMLRPELLWIVGPNQNELLFNVNDARGLKALELKQAENLMLDYSSGG